MSGHCPAASLRAGSAPAGECCPCQVGFQGQGLGLGLRRANVLKPHSLLAHDTDEWPVKGWVRYKIGEGGGGNPKG